jgi:uncharacterized protein YicC (UPF0701 family)
MTETKEEVRQKALKKAAEIGWRMERKWPARSAIDPAELAEGDIGLIPAEASEEVAEIITDVVAEILQAWLNAGSERDVTGEELGPVILEHVKGWDSSPRNLE